jgi:ribonuclease-3
MSYDKVQEKIGYSFSNPEYLKRALTHSSYANEMKSEKILHNERLEFLGDSVLGIVVSDHLFSAYPELAEGELTKIRARVVCERTLGEIAKRLDLGGFMFFGRGEEATGGRERISILADALEALIAAIYLDGGIEPARTFILDRFDSKIEDATKGRVFIDFKTHLQEIVQVEKNQVLAYEVIREEGPDHSKIFHTRVSLNGKEIGIGKGRSKKESEQEAAKVGIETLEGQNV